MFSSVARTLAVVAVEATLERQSLAQILQMKEDGAMADVVLVFLLALLSAS